MDAQRAIAIIERPHNQIPILLKLLKVSTEFIKWKHSTEVALQNFLGELGQHFTNFTEIGYSFSREPHDPKDI